mmetsp:Transcript_79046/g.139619  ORF Transcript_79046/g.139619 Transcript_79046/m.139619 type:complete len:83 (+) Transcript_79046:891-1139(+)
MLFPPLVVGVHSLTFQTWMLLETILDFSNNDPSGVKKVGKKPQSVLGQPSTHDMGGMTKCRTYFGDGAVHGWLAGAAGLRTH